MNVELWQNKMQDADFAMIIFYNDLLRAVTPVRKNEDNLIFFH